MYSKFEEAPIDIVCDKYKNKHNAELQRVDPGTKDMR